MTKAPQAPVFAMPAEWDVADMLRADLADARRQWLDAAKHDPEEYEKRSQSDFLADVNHDDGEHLDFHSLRHTCGAWLAITGACPKAVRPVMRHSTITLTKDTCGHLFPGQKADAVARLPGIMGDDPEALRATGTDDAHADTPTDPHLKPRQLGRETVRASATRRDESGSGKQSEASKQTNSNGVKCAPVRCDGMQQSHRPDSNRRPAVYKVGQPAFFLSFS